MSEIEKLLHELRNMKSDQPSVTNSKDVWKALGEKSWAEAGFQSEEEAKAWMANNPYSNL